MLYFTLLYLMLFLIGCTTPAPMVIRIDSKTFPAISQVILSPNQYTDNVVRWGGTIHNIKNLESTTEIEVIGRELDQTARPTNKHNNAGRFIVRISGFLDPLLYAPQREITVVGNIAGSVKRLIGKFTYPYPLIVADRYLLWPVKVKRPGNADPFLYDPWSWHSPWWYHQ